MTLTDQEIVAIIRDAVRMSLADRAVNAMARLQIEDVMIVVVLALVCGSLVFG